MAKTYLVQAGLVEATKRAHFRITDRGRKVLAEHPTRIDNEYLSRFAEFIQFRERSRVSGTLPESIGQLSQLHELYLDNNLLSTLPESIGQLSQLQELYLNNNQLSTLLESIGRLSQLQQLDLSSNQLSALPV